MNCDHWVEPLTMCLICLRHVAVKSIVTPFWLIECTETTQPAKVKSPQLVDPRMRKVKTLGDWTLTYMQAIVQPSDLFATVLSCRKSMCSIEKCTIAFSCLSPVALANITHIAYCFLMTKKLIFKRVFHWFLLKMDKANETQLIVSRNICCDHNEVIVSLFIIHYFHECTDYIKVCFKLPLLTA